MGLVFVSLNGFWGERDTKGERIHSRSEIIDPLAGEIPAVIMCKAADESVRLVD